MRKMSGNLPNSTINAAVLHNKNTFVYLLFHCTITGFWKEGIYLRVYSSCFIRAALSQRPQTPAWLLSDLFHRLFCNTISCQIFEVASWKFCGMKSVIFIFVLIFSFFSFLGGRWYHAACRRYVLLLLNPKALWCKTPEQSNGNCDRFVGCRKLSLGLSVVLIRWCQFLTVTTGGVINLSCVAVLETKTILGISGESAGEGLILFCY